MKGLRANVLVFAGVFIVSGGVNAERAVNPPPPLLSATPPLSRTFDKYPSEPVGCWELARHYDAGVGIVNDPYLAAHWARIAAQLGSQPAASWLASSAEGGNPFAQLQYGLLLKEGVGAKRDSAAAHAWGSKAVAALQGLAQAEDFRAVTGMAVAHSKGLGVTVDLEKGRALLHSAAKKFYPPALGAWGLALLNGRGGATDASTALVALEGAAGLGDFESARHLGQAYLDGKVLPKDSALALEWLKLTANNGDRESQFQVALMLEQGDGTPQDYTAAVDFYSRAVERGSADAANNLGLLTQRGHGTTADPVKAIELFKQASAWGSSFGAYNLGRAHRDGLGVPVNPLEARTAFERAASAGHVNAKKELAKLDAIITCLKSKHLTVLFQQPLRCAWRSSLRSAIVSGGSKATREDERFWYDTYDSSAVLEGSTVLSVGYTAAGEFAHAEYAFPSHVNTEQVKLVAEMVSTKYGKPRRSKGSLSLGPVSFEWKLADGILVRVSRGWPDTSTSLEYIQPARFAQLERELAQEKARKKVERSLAQSNAF